MENRDLTWHAGVTRPEDREAIVAQKGCVLWLTGLSGCGKSTVARALEEKLTRAGRLCYVLDGDNIRQGLNADPGFSIADRDENLRRIAEVAALFADAGIVTVTAFISPLRQARSRARDRVPAGRFLEIYLNVPLEVCEARDPKHLYKRARSGDIENFTGIDSPYEEPLDAELALDTTVLSPDACAARIMKLLRERSLIAPEVK